MLPAIESTILELKSGLKLEFKDDETVKVLRVSTTESKIRIETKYNSSEALFIAADGFRILTNEADAITLPFNRLSIVFKVESIKSLTFNYK
jgi:hypothetical protein